MVLDQRKAKKVDFGKSPMPTVIQVPMVINFWKIPMPTVIRVPTLIRKSRVHA